MRLDPPWLWLLTPLVLIGIPSWSVAAFVLALTADRWLARTSVVLVVSLMSVCGA